MVKRPRFLTKPEDGIIEFSMPVCGFSLKKTVLSHGWVRLAPFGWDESTEMLSFRVRMGQKVVLTNIVQLEKSNLLVTSQVTSRLRPKLETVISRILMLDWCPQSITCQIRKFNPTVASYLEHGGGRLLRGSSWFEDFVKTVCTINTSWVNTKSMVQRLVDGYGEGGFPAAKTVAELSNQDLKNNAGVGYRSTTLIEGAQFAVRSNLDANPHVSISKLRLDLRSIHGIGPYAEDHLMVLLGDFSRIPVDSRVIGYCREYLGLKTGAKNEEVNAMFLDWGDYKFIGYKFGRIVKDLDYPKKLDQAPG